MDYVESWEFMNNTSDVCNFLAPITGNWNEDFEARYPDKHSNITRFKIMHDWVVSTKNNLGKFKVEFEEHFDMHFSLIYYVYTMLMLMIDQRAKNMFLTYWAETGKWQPWFYDNDTCLGINNDGALIYDYYHEDIDFVNGVEVYSGQNSVLWNNFRLAFAEEIQETYQDLRNNGKITYDKIIEYFVTNGSDKWSASIYNEDSDYKYISMLRESNDATNLYRVRGNGEEHLKYFMSNRIKYLDSKWYASDYADNLISLRIFIPTIWNAVRPNANISITPFSNMYVGVRYKANGTLQSITLNSATEIQQEAFSYCRNLQFVDLASAKSIGSTAFTSCSGLQTVILRSATLCTLANANVFASSGISAKTGYIYVPSSLIGSYKTATNWSTYASQFRAIEDYPDITG